MKNIIPVLLMLLFSAEIYAFTSTPATHDDGTPGVVQLLNPEPGISDLSGDLDDFAKKRKSSKKSRAVTTDELAFEDGIFVISAGYGIPDLTVDVMKRYEGNDDYTNKILGPIHFKVEYGLNDNIGLGLSVNYSSMKPEWNFTDIFIYDTNTYHEGFDVTSIHFTARLNYHFFVTDKLDVYGGFGVGYHLFNQEYFSDSEEAVVFELKDIPVVAFEVGVGSRYYFTPNIGVYIELGAAKSVVQGGVAVKF